MKARLAFILLYALLLAGCRLAPYDARTEQDLLALESAHLGVVDTCAVMTAFDSTGLEAKATIWRAAYGEAMRHQERLVDNDDLRRESFATAKGHFDQVTAALEASSYPLSPAFAGNLRDQARETYRHLVNGERGRKGSPDNQ